MRRALGIQVDYDQPAGVLRLSMSDYIGEIIKREHLDKCSIGTRTPISPGHILGTEADLATANPGRSREALSTTGELLWMAHAVRPDLMLAAGLLARYSGKPTDECVKVTKHVWRYLRRTQFAALVYRRVDGPEPLVGWTDADWAGCPSTARSTGCYLFFLFGNLVSWESKRQPDVAGSSMESETVAAFFAIYRGLSQLRWIRQVLPPLGIATPDTTPIYCDNQGAVAWIQNAKANSKVRHIHYRYRSIKEWVARKVIRVPYISTKDQLADIGTKALPADTFSDLASRCGLDLGTPPRRRLTDGSKSTGVLAIMPESSSDPLYSSVTATSAVAFAQL